MSISNCQAHVFDILLKKYYIIDMTVFLMNHPSHLPDHLISGQSREGFVSNYDRKLSVSGATALRDQFLPKRSDVCS
jgi:hypothetical protein